MIESPHMKMKDRWAIPAAIVMLTVLRVALGALFIISSYYKLSHPELFVDAVQNYHLLPVTLADIFGTVLPWAELCFGWCLVLGIFPTFAAVVCILMTLTFVVANVTSFFKDVGEACGCLGDLVTMSHTTSLVVDFVMLAVAGLLIYQRKRAGVVGIGHLLKLQRLHLPRTAPLVLSAIIIAIAIVVTFSLIPKEKAPWEESIDSALKDNAVVVLLFWKGEPVDFLDEFRMMMELDELYGQSVRIERIDCAVSDDAARKFEVNDYPTIVVIEGKGKKGYIEYPQRFDGAGDRDALVVAIDEALASKP